MSLTLLIGVLLILSSIGFWMGRSRAVASVNGRIASLHSVPLYYGMFVAIWAGLPSLVLILFWVALRQPITESLVLDGMSADQIAAWGRVMLAPLDLQSLLANLDQEDGALTATQRQLLLINIRNLADGNAQFVNPAILDVLT